MSGGVHLKSGMSCVIVSTLIANSISLIELKIGFTYIITVIAFIIVVFWSPTNLEGKSLIPKKYYSLLKILSTTLVGMNFFIHSDMLALAFLMQGITLFFKRR
jgi:accessory gene regulator B